MTKNGIRYDDPKEVTVMFTDNGNGGLDAAIDGDEAKIESWTAAFKNSYNAEGSFTLAGTKSFNGTIGEGQYSVTITRTDTEPDVTKEAAVGTDGRWSFPTDDGFTGFTLEDVKNNVQPVYRVSEKNTGVAGVVYDTNEYDVKVRLADKGDGTLIVEPDKADNSLAFINTIPGPGETEIHAVKTVSGMNLESDEYEFTLTPDAANGLGEKVQTAKNKGSDVSFTLKYDAAQVNIPKGESRTYKYELAETDGGKAGVTYDNNKYGVTVTVTNNGTDLQVASVIDQDKAEFVNTYSAKGSTSVTVAKKLMSSGEESDIYPENKGFTFKLYDDRGAEIDSRTVYKKGETVVFDGDYFSFTQEDLKDSNGNYVETTDKYFYISEVNDGIDGITYDDDTAVVKVTLTNKDGKLDVSKSVRKADGTVEKTEGIIAGLQRLFGSGSESNGADAVFENTLTKSGEIGFEGLKVLKYADGNDVPMTDELKAQLTGLMFTVTGNGQTVTGTTGTDGKVTFNDKITFSRTGEYDFVIAETGKNDSKPAGFGLDWAEGKTFKVTVTDDKVNYGRLAAAMEAADDAALDNGVFTFTCKDTMNKEFKVDKSFFGENIAGVEAELKLANTGLLGVTFNPVTWTVTDTAGSYVFENGLAAGDYILQETRVPDGFEKADDITFTVNEDGSYVLNGTRYAQTVPVRMINKTTTEADTSIAITKTWKDPYADKVTERPTAYAQIQQRVKGSGEEGWTNYGSPVAISLQDDGTYRYVDDKLPSKRYNKTTFEYDEYEYRVSEVEVKHCAGWQGIRHVGCR